MRVTVLKICKEGDSAKDLQRELEELEIGGRMVTIQTTDLLRLAWILRRILQN